MSENVPDFCLKNTVQMRINTMIKTAKKANNVTSISCFLFY